MDKTIHPNRNYQDSVFSKLFSNEEAALELYNALSGTNYGPETKIRITTLENVLFLEKYNDLSFTVEDRIIVMAFSWIMRLKATIILVLRTLMEIRFVPNRKSRKIFLQSVSVS